MVISWVISHQFIRGTRQISHDIHSLTHPFGLFVLVKLIKASWYDILFFIYFYIFGYLPPFSLSSRCNCPSAQSTQLRSLHLRVFFLRFLHIFLCGFYTSRMGHSTSFSVYLYCQILDLCFDCICTSFTGALFSCPFPIIGPLTLVRHRPILPSQFSEFLVPRRIQIGDLNFQY